MAHKITCLFWLCLVTLSLDSSSATYTREESGENTKSSYSAVNSIIGASESSRQHTKQTLDTHPAYYGHVGDGVMGENPNEPVNPAGYSLSGQESQGYGRASLGIYDGCTETGCPLRPREQSPRTAVGETFDIDNHRDPIGTDEKTLRSGGDGIDVRGGSAGSGRQEVGVGGRFPQGYGATALGGALPTQTLTPQGYGLPLGNGAIHGYGATGGSVIPQGYGPNVQLAPSGAYGSPYPYANTPQLQPGYATNSIDAGYPGNVPVYGNYPAGYPPYYVQNVPSPGYQYPAPPAHGHPPPPQAHGHLPPPPAHGHFPPSPPHSHLPPPHHHHPHHGYNTLDHSLKTNTEYNEVGHHEGQFQGNAGYGYGSGYGGYNGMFNRPGY